MGKKVYAVRKGRKTGIFNVWSECEKQVKGFSNADFKSFRSEEEALAYLNGQANINQITSSENSSASNILEVYVDGSYESGKDIIGYGCVFLKNAKEIHTIYEFDEANEEHTMGNVSAEITAALTAVKWALKNNYKRIILYYDYKGVKDWVDGTWTARKEETENYALKMNQYQKYIEIDFKKVPAHSGNYYNEKADRLAKQAIQRALIKNS